MIQMTLTAPSATICLAYCIKAGIYRNVGVFAPTDLILEELTIDGPAGLLASLQLVGVGFDWNSARRRVTFEGGGVDFFIMPDIDRVRGRVLDAGWLAGATLYDDLEAFNRIAGPQIRRGAYPTLIRTY